MDGAATLDHETPHAANVVQVFEKGSPVEGSRAQGDDVHTDGETRAPGPLGTLLRRVDDLPAARVPEVGGRVQLPRAADGHLEGILRLPGRHSRGPPLGRVDQQAGVVGADGADADEDRVAGRPYLVDPVEVGGAGEQQPIGAGVVQVAVEGDGGGQQDVGEGHGRTFFE